jgi:hypothetical protein
LSDFLLYIHLSSLTEKRRLHLAVFHLGFGNSDFGFAVPEIRPLFAASLYSQKILSAQSACQCGSKSEIRIPKSEIE